uniref:NR LBD domain-containing protein n=1 Tax=Ditylenchus dipsaci TaxID=166011 RepID=A0A915D2T3_9BILA
MERGCLSLMYSMLNDWYQPFDSLIHDLKVATLREFSMRFTLLDQCYRTMQTFKPEENRFVMHYGQYIDGDNMEYFFAENKDPEMLARMAINIMVPCRRATAKMRQMAIRDIEVAALAGIILWNEVGNLNVEDTDKIRNQIYTEIHNNMILTYGVSGTGARLGSLLGLLHDVDVIQKEISESITIGKIFNPHHYEVWDDI